MLIDKIRDEQAILLHHNILAGTLSYQARIMLLDKSENLTEQLFDIGESILTNLESIIEEQSPGTDMSIWKSVEKMIVAGEVEVSQLRVFNPSFSLIQEKIYTVHAQRSKFPVVFDSELQRVQVQTQPILRWEPAERQIIKDDEEYALSFLVESLAPFSLQTYLLIEFNDEEHCDSALRAAGFDVKEQWC